MKAQNDDQRGAVIARPGEVYVRDLSAEEQQVLQELYHRTPDATIRTRCQIILLSAKLMSVSQIAQVTFYSEDTVARCIHEFNQSRLESLPGFCQDSSLLESDVIWSFHGKALLSKMCISGNLAFCMRKAR